MTINIGVLGAARINSEALLRPARHTDGVEVFAIAARDKHRATKYAQRHGISRVHDSYDALLADTDITAVYIPLPAALHGEWALRAIDAGKHVLVEKPFTANATEARTVARAASESGLVVMEAHHTSFHPFTARLKEIVQSGVLGELQRVSGWFHVPLPPEKDIRWKYELGGGSLMDVGCYPLRMIRDVVGEPTLRSAVALQRGSIDRRMTATYDVAGAVATVDCGIWSSRVLGGGFIITGSDAVMKVRSPFHPQLLGSVRVDGPGVKIRERADRISTYRYQLAAFRDAIVSQKPGNLDEAVKTMALIDATYQAAGMSVRRPWAERNL